MLKIWIPALLTAAMAVSAQAAPAQAAPVQWTVASGGNGHWYQFVTVNKTLAAARTDALARTHLGLSGHLANVSSAAESIFLGGLTSAFTVSNFGWIGGSDAAVEGQWRWMDGPEAGVLFWSGAGAAQGGFSPTGYAGWVNQEPNNLSNNEHGIRLFASGGWTDTPESVGQRFFVEYSLPAVAVPEPGSLALTALALAGLAAARRRRA